MTKGGILTTLYGFASKSTATGFPAVTQGGLVLAADGNFYGGTAYGPYNDDGNLFGFNPTGAALPTPTPTVTPTPTRE